MNWKLAKVNALFLAKNIRRLQRSCISYNSPKRRLMVTSVLAFLTHFSEVILVPLVKTNLLLLQTITSFHHPQTSQKKTDEEIMNLVSTGIDGREYAQEKSKPKSNPWMFVNTAQSVNRQETNIEPKTKKKRFRFKCSDSVREESRDIKQTDEETSSYFSKTGESLDFQVIKICFFFPNFFRI